MNVIHVSSPVIIIPDRVLPETALPDAPFAPMIGCRCNTTRACLLDFAPAPGEVGIAFRQLQDAVQMVWQDNDALHIEWSVAPDLAHRRAERVDRGLIAKDSLAAPCHQGKEIAAARDISTPIVTHYQPFRELVDALRLSTLQNPRLEPESL